MKSLYTYIKTHIETQVTEVLTVDQWNDQIRRDYAEAQEAPFQSPAVFIEFQVQEIYNYSYKKCVYDLLILLHVSLVNYEFDQTDTLDFIDKLNAALQGLRGNEDHVTQFSSLNRHNVDLDEDHNMVDKPLLAYRTRYVDLAAAPEITTHQIETLNVSKWQEP
jgi:hypothetical protein